jgi:outer membrane protein TolC
MKTIARPLSLAAWLAAVSVPALAAAQPPPPAPPASADPKGEAIESKLDAVVTPGSGLTSDEVATRAAATSFDVRSHRAAVEAAAASVDQAVVGFFPRVTLTARYLRLNSLPNASLGTLVAPEGTFNAVTPLPKNAQLLALPFTLPVLPNDTTLHADLTLPLSDYIFRLAQGYSAASHSVSAEEQSERASRSKAALDGRVAYYAWARARLAAIVARQALDQARGHLVDVKHGFEAGSTSKADVLRVESQVAASELLVQRADGYAKTSEESVRIAMHEPGAPRSYALGEDLHATLKPLGGPRDPAALYAEALEKRPELRALDDTAYSLKQQARVARAQYLPKIDGLGQLSYDNPDPRVFPPTQTFQGGWAVGGQVTWTLNDIGAANTQARVLDAKRAQVEAQRAALADGVRNEVTQAEQALEDAEFAIDTNQRELTAAEESYRVRRELFRNGRATSVELTDAETELVRASLDVVNARVDLRVARARLLHATGRDVPPAPER